ncbi:MAG: GntR family transcriptional regulator [Actinobacteria bacterium]|nr:MAG: GntR family transcriptional regulator [Actinomycetota bacterium]
MEIEDSRPLWVQLADEFRSRIVCGQWAPGSKIPSVRELALDAKVNPNTVQRALTEVDRTGLTVTERTAGRFVTEDQSLVDAARLDLAQHATDQHISAMRGLGINKDTTMTLLLHRWSEMEKGQ